jgi:predicted secreted protein
VLGSDPGAPAVHGLKMKAVWTTVVSAVVFGAFYWAYVTKAVALEDLATLWGLLK